MRTVKSTFKFKDYFRFATAFSAFMSFKSCGKSAQHNQHPLTMNPILRQALRKYDGLRKQVDAVLLGDDGDVWEAELKKFLAKRPCWTPPKSKKGDAIVLRAEIDLDAKPGLPFNGATVEKHIGGGKVVIEKRADGLYIDGKKVILHRVVRQMNGKSIVGHELRKELDGKPVLNACILDFLMANQGFIPEDWKKDDAGNTIYIFFWGTIFRDSYGHLFVRDFCFLDGKWQQYCHWLNSDWYGHSPAALLTS